MKYVVVHEMLRFRLYGTILKAMNHQNPQHYRPSKSYIFFLFQAKEINEN